MRMRHFFAFSFAAAVASVVACSSSPGSSCGSYFDTAEARATKCQTTQVLDPSLKSSFEQYCQAIANAPGASNFAGQIDACNAKVQAADCNTSINCMIVGSLPDGSACGVSTQCAGGRCDNTNTAVPNSEVTCGKCASYVAVGGACGNGATCDPQTGSCLNNTCVAFAQQGQNCQNAPCVSGLQCDATLHTCQPLPTKGQQCQFECQSPYRCISGTCADAVQQGGACTSSGDCAANLTCDTATTHTCIAVTLAGVGQPCGFVQNQVVLCQSNLKCQQGTTASGTCVAPKNAGEACTVGKGECALFLACVNGTCQAPDYSVCK